MELKTVKTNLSHFIVNFNHTLTVKSLDYKLKHF